MVFPLSELIPEIRPIKIVDVGAMSIGEGKEPYANLLKAARCEVIGFEPVADELEKLRAAGWEGRTFLPFVIGDGTEQTFYECNEPMTSSLLEPDTALLARFQLLEELTRVVSRTPVETKRLDDIPEAAEVDLLKLDIQGGEMLALTGAQDVLRNTLVVHTEVEFVPMYKNQPLFADIDAYLRERGFLFHRFGSVSGRTFKPMIYKDLTTRMSQVLWADAVFVRDFRTFGDMDAEALLRLATILHDNYRSLDLAAVALEAYDQQMGTSLHGAYVGRFEQVSA